MDVSSKMSRFMSSRSTNLISEDTTSKNFYLKRKGKSTVYLDCDDQHGSDKNARKTRSQEEKRHRDKMNNFIGELAALVPTSNSKSCKLDKLSVLRMAVQHMKLLRGLVNHNPAFLSDEEIKHLLQRRASSPTTFITSGAACAKLTPLRQAELASRQDRPEACPTLKQRAADGFLFVADCDRGKILFVSESVHKILNYSKNNLIGQSLFDYVHPKDIDKVKEQLSSAATVPQEELTDAKSCPLVKTDIHPSYLRVCSGMRRSFFCRMKCNQNMEDENFLSSCLKKKAGSKAFCTIHSTGYLKSWSSAEVNLDENNEPDNDGCILSCLVAVGRLHPHTVSWPVWSHVKVKPVEFVSRQDIDGKFVFVDQRTTAILAYLPQELLGTSIYEYVHEDDIAHLAECHRRVLQMREKINTNCYKLKIKDGSFITLRSRWFTFMNPWTKEVEYIVSTSTVVTTSGDRPEISCHLPAASPHTTATVLKPGEGKLGLQTVPGIPGGTTVDTGKTGQMISEKQLEIQSSGEQAEGERGEHGQREGQRQAQDYSTTQEKATSAQEKEDVFEALEAAQEVYVEGSGPQASGQGQAEEVKT